MPTRCLASRISFLTVLDLWPFLWRNRPKISPQELTWVKSVLSYGGDFASGLVGAPERMMTGAIPAAPDWKTTSGGTFKGFTEPELRYDLSIQNSLPPRNPHFWFFLQKKVTNFSLTCWDHVACFFWVSTPKKVSSSWEVFRVCYIVGCADVRRRTVQTFARQPEITWVMSKTRTPIRLDRLASKTLRAPS